MSEPVYITEEQRDLILKLFGGVRAERMAETVEALEAADRYFTRFHEAVGRGPVSVTTANKIRSALAKASQSQTGGE